MPLLLSATHALTRRPEYEQAASERADERRKADELAKQTTRERNERLVELKAEIEALKKLREESHEQASSSSASAASAAASAASAASAEPTPEMKRKVVELAKQVSQARGEVAAATAAGAPPAGACDYGNPRFWEEAYARGDGEADEWYFELTYMVEKNAMPRVDSLPSVVANKEPQCLVLGCGKSTACELLHNHGYGHIVGIDIAKSAISAMRQQHRGHQDLVFLAMDVCKGGCATLKDASFDLVYDKGTLDAIFCAERDSFERAAAALGETARLLKPGGTFVLVTHSDRSDWLYDEKYAWHVNVLRLEPPAPPEDSPDARLGDNYKNFRYYVYHCEKHVTKAPPPPPPPPQQQQQQPSPPTPVPAKMDVSPSTSSTAMATTATGTSTCTSTSETETSASSSTSTSTSTASTSSTDRIMTPRRRSAQPANRNQPPGEEERARVSGSIARAMVAFAFFKYGCACDAAELASTTKQIEERAFNNSGGKGGAFDWKKYRSLASFMTIAGSKALFAP